MLHSLLVFSLITSMIGIRVAKQIAISKTMFKKLLNLPRCLSKEDVTEAERQVPQKLDNVSS